MTYPFRLQENAIEEKLVVEEYRRLLSTVIEKKRQDDPRLWMAAAINAAVIGGNKLRLLLNTVLDSGLLQDQTTFARRIITSILQIGSQHFRDIFRKEHRGHLIDIDAEIDGLFAPPEELATELPERGQPKTRTEPKIGRNDPCPCGSGKKYKKCCGACSGSETPTPKT
ncbi:MAG TPA: SEC-C metal-binding domain-containing protein [Lentisphaeria bacterium]|nr:SEC-C metal-binding domain-containing protein [Lentisphaeria bacterium]